MFTECSASQISEALESVKAPEDTWRYWYSIKSFQTEAVTSKVDHRTVWQNNIMLA